MPCVSSVVFLQDSTGFLHHFHQTSLGFPRVSTAEESTAFRKSCTASRRLQRSLEKACHLLSCFSLEISTLLPCGRRAGCIRKLILLTTSLWWVQLSAPHMVILLILMVCWQGLTWWQVLLLFYLARQSHVHPKWMCASNNVFTSPISTRSVWLRAAISTLYRQKPLPTTAVLYCGLSDPALSIILCIVSAPIVEGITFVSFLRLRPLRGSVHGLPTKVVGAPSTLL